MTSVLVVDDQAIFRRAAAALVRTDPRLHLIGQAATGEEAVRLAQRLHPDLVLMDVRLPGIDGIEATRRILAALPATCVVLVSTHEISDLPTDLAACGAAGFLRKQDIDTPALLRYVA